MEKWLKETIPGIVLLGGIGSLFAVAILKLFAFLLRRYFIRLAKSYRNYERKSLYLEAFIVGRLSGGSDIGKLAVYLLRNIYLFILFFFGCVFSLIVLTVSILRANAVYLSVINIAAMTLFIICTYRLVRMIWATLLGYSVYIYPGFTGPSLTEKLVDDKPEAPAK